MRVLPSLPLSLNLATSYFNVNFSYISLQILQSASGVHGSSGRMETTASVFRR